MMVFGSFLPVSGLVKDYYEAQWLAGGWPNGGFWGNIRHHIDYVIDLSIASHTKILDTGLLQGILAAGFLFGLYKVWKRELSPYYIAFVAFSIFHLFLYATRLPHFTGYGTWYFTVQFMLILLSLFFGVEACFRFLAFVIAVIARSHTGAVFGRFYPVFAVLFCMAAFFAAFSTVRDFRQVDERTNRFYRAALWINENLPDGVTIGAHSAGILGYFVENRRVVNLDGLINSVEYFDVLQRRGFGDYMLQNIDYYADYSPMNLEETGICWEGYVPAENLRLLAKWPINETETYYILEITPSP